MDCNQQYLHIINETAPEMLYTLPHKQMGIHPTGFVVLIEGAFTLDFTFSLCPLFICSASSTELSGKNPHDVIIQYSQDKDGSLEKILYTLWEQYKDTRCESTEKSMKRYIYDKKVPARKIIIPCFKRLENLDPVLRRFEMVKLPSEGYKPQILLVEHSPYPEMKEIAEKYNCEWIWIYMDPKVPHLPIGQFNKALAYDKAFLYSTPATWYLFHDNDVLVPMDFWDRLDLNIQRTGAKFLQPYTHRCLKCLQPGPAGRVREELALIDDDIPEDFLYPLTPGAPGGSLYITRERYLEVGGHDPTVSWGYGPEDSLFWDKLQVLDPIAFADDPPIELIHLWHPSAAPNNPFLDPMNWFVKIFFASKSVDEKKLYMSMKKELLEKLLLDNRQVAR